MPNLTNGPIRSLEAAIEKYEAAGATSTESAIRDLLTDLRHSCDRRGVNFDDPLEGSLDVYMEECELNDSDEEVL